MPRRYQVRTEFNLSTPSSPEEQVLNEYIDIPLLLSQRLQKQVRQGRVINIHKVSCILKPNVASSEQDWGLAFTGELAHVPATRNSVRAWQEAFKVWSAQKKLKVNAIGGLVRFDDFEVAWNSDHINSRTSTVYAEGMLDSDLESVCIYGTSTDGTDLTLEDIFESAQTIAPPSRFPMGNTVVKASKYVEEFPDPVKTMLFSHYSTTEAGESALTAQTAGAQINGSQVHISDSASLCGMVKVLGYMLPENVNGSLQDEMTLSITLDVSIGRSLVYKPRKAKAKKVVKRYARKRTYSKRRK